MARVKQCARREENAPRYPSARFQGNAMEGNSSKNDKKREKKERKKYKKSLDEENSELENQPLEQSIEVDNKEQIMEVDNKTKNKNFEVNVSKLISKIASMPEANFHEEEFQDDDKKNLKIV